MTYLIVCICVISARARGKELLTYCSLLTFHLYLYMTITDISDYRFERTINVYKITIDVKDVINSVNNKPARNSRLVLIGSPQLS